MSPLHQFLPCWPPHPSLTCAQDRAENSSANERRAMISLLSYRHGLCFESTSMKKRVKATPTLAYFRASFFSLSAPFNTFRMSWTQPSPNSFSNAIPVMEGVQKRCLSATHTTPLFSCADNRVQGSGAYYQYATPKRHKSPQCSRGMPLDVGHHAGERVRGYGYYSGLVR